MLLLLVTQQLTHDAAEIAKLQQEVELMKASSWSVSVVGHASWLLVFPVSWTFICTGRTCSSCFSLCCGEAAARYLSLCLFLSLGGAQAFALFL